MIKGAPTLPSKKGSEKISLKSELLTSDCIMVTA
jgi:hypothetical protein